MTGILSSETSRLGESVLLRYLESRQLTEAQVVAVTKVKQEVLAGFEIETRDRVIGYRYFAQRFREAAARAIEVAL